VNIALQMYVEIVNFDVWLAHTPGNTIIRKPSSGKGCVSQAGVKLQRAKKGVSQAVVKDA